MPDKNSQIQLKIDDSLRDMRLDKALTELLQDYSRSSLQEWLKQGLITVDGRMEKAKYKLLGNEMIYVNPPQPIAYDWPPQSMSLQLVSIDEHYIIVNKPAGLVVHPGAGNPDNTLLNGLLYEFPELAVLPRAGIVHRLDKDTTGLMVVARTELARQHLIQQLQTREMHRQYVAILNGVLVAGGTINQPIGRNPRDRLKMAVSTQGKPAITEVKVREKFRSHCLIQANLKTGRTHQIRVHLQWRGFALLGDPLYRTKTRIPKQAEIELSQQIQQFSRQALHAEELSFIHPATSQLMHFQAEIPHDMQHLIELLRADAKAHG